MLLDTFTQFDPLGRYRFSQGGQDVGAPVDVRHDGDTYVIDADLPGVDPDSVDVTVERETLTIRAERSDVSTRQGAQWYVRERRASTAVRRLVLGEDIDPDGVRARFDDGVLSVVVPTTADSRRHRIPVTVGSGGRKALAGSDAGSSASGDEGKAGAARSHES